MTKLQALLLLAIYISIKFINMGGWMRI